MHKLLRGMIAPFALTCVTEFPTTSYLAEIKENRLHVRVVHHNGPGYMPIYNTVIVANDLPKVTKAAKTLPQLGADWKFSWPLEKCKFHENNRYECFGGSEKVILNGIEVDPFGIFTTVAKEDGVAGPRETVSVDLALYINDEAFNTSMPYQKSECWSQGQKDKK